MLATIPTRCHQRQLVSRLATGLVSRCCLLACKASNTRAPAQPEAIQLFGTTSYLPIPQLCRNVRLVGDDSSPDTMFGAQGLMSTPSNRQRASLQFSHVELQWVGQAFRLGRYPIHFHMHGDGSGSWVKGCSIHHSFQRAVTIHGTHRVLLQVGSIWASWAELPSTANSGSAACSWLPAALAAVQCNDAWQPPSACASHACCCLSLTTRGAYYMCSPRTSVSSPPPCAGQRRL